MTDIRPKTHYDLPPDSGTDPILPTPANRRGLLDHIPPTTLPVAILASLVLVLSIGLAVALATRPTVPAADHPIAEPELTRTTPPVEYGSLTPEVISLDLSIVSQQCFGSAGCRVEFEIEPVFSAVADPIEPGSRWLVTYEVTGGEDPYINSFEITVGASDGSGAEVRYTTNGLEDRISTPPAPVNLVATVTGVRES